MADYNADTELQDLAIRAAAGLVHEMIDLILGSGHSAALALWAVHVVRLTLEAELRRQTDSASSTLELITAMPQAAQELYDAIRSVPRPSPLHFVKPAGNA
jgi:hypothetical protein